ncbi:MAG: hypothetical protein Q8L48_13505 [Archangium sp.]|nr:hypothetical protein [Archangium sp.]
MQANAAAKPPSAFRWLTLVLADGSTWLKERLAGAASPSRAEVVEGRVAGAPPVALPLTFAVFLSRRRRSPS